MKKILIVEDDEKIAKGLSIRLKSAGYEVTVAPDALTGVAAALKMGFSPKIVGSVITVTTAAPASHSLRRSSLARKNKKKSARAPKTKSITLRRISPAVNRNPLNSIMSSSASGANGFLPIQVGTKRTEFRTMTQKTPVRMPSTKSRPTTASLTWPESTRLHDMSEFGQRRRTCGSRAT